MLRIFARDLRQFVKDISPVMAPFLLGLVFGGGIVFGAMTGMHRREERESTVFAKTVVIRYHVKTNGEIKVVDVSTNSW